MKIMMFVVFHVMILNTMQSLMRLLACAHGWFAIKRIWEELIEFESTFQTVMRGKAFLEYWRKY